MQWHIMADKRHSRARRAWSGMRLATNLICTSGLIVMAVLLKSAGLAGTWIFVQVLLVMLFNVILAGVNVRLLLLELENNDE